LVDQGRSSGFDDMVAELQKQITQQERAIYSDRVIQEAHHPSNLGRMSAPDAYAVVRGGCGDTMEIYLRLEGQRVQAATFMTDGCGPSVACGSALTQMVQGLSLEQAGQVRPEDLLETLGGLPEDSLHCAELTVNTLQEAIANRP
jgi:nitrogen fixation protein NifU and related proteins